MFSPERVGTPMQSATNCCQFNSSFWTCQSPYALRQTYHSLLILFCFQVHAQALGQGNITLSVKDAPAEQVFRELKKQSGYGFVYPSEVLTRLNRITLTVTKASLKRYWTRYSKASLYTYSIIDKSGSDKASGGSRHPATQTRL